MTGLVCAGCGASQPALSDRPYPFRCARADELPDADHVVQPLPAAPPIEIDRAHLNPFLRYRRFLFSYAIARRLGIGDDAFVDLVRRLDDRVAALDGRGFEVTPCSRHEPLEIAAGMETGGAIWVKNETGNVSGSHKARHLMGVMLYLEIVRASGLDDPRTRGLAIASCGNAALAAAVVARAAGYPLRVFVPVTADPATVERIEALGATIHVCSRDEASRGDPAYLQFRQAVAQGALPFCCQGSENGLTIEGGETLWLEVAESLGTTAVDRVFVQVGGGALASACVRAFTALHEAGRFPAMPRIHAVQTEGAHPLKRAFDRLVANMPPNFTRSAIDEAVGHARLHRSAFMWPWETEPKSVAHGILDDETYDWAAVVEGMLRSGGSPLVVSEAGLRAANSIARETTGIDVDHTGSAGLAGLFRLIEDQPGARSEKSVVVFSGVRRSRSGP